MGVKNLWDILESCKQTLPLQHLQNKRLCVDLSCWLIQLRNACKGPACVREKLYLRSLFHRLKALIALNCSLIFVTDGSIPAVKLSTYRRRLGSSSEVAHDETTSLAAPSLRRNMGSEFSCMIKEAKVLGMALGIPCLDGLEEAEAQCALLNSGHICDGCFSADSDSFLFGAKTVYRDIVLGDGGYVVCYEMIDIERKLGFGRNSLITLALILGSDYCHGLQGFGPETACQIVKSLGEADVLHKILSHKFKFERKTKGIKKGKACSHGANEPSSKEQMLNISENKDTSELKHQFLQVIDAYLKPKCHSLDSEAVQRVCIQHKFQRNELQQICDRFFSWDPKKTDEYILPKVAERDLRRFANLRAASSHAGFQIPLEKMPVSCPVSAIVKQRKVHGEECFEVSWQGVEGLKTSIVPAALIQSACPEKISDFVATIAEKKKIKRKAKPMKSYKVSVAEVDLQLNDLLLHTVPKSNDFNPAIICSSESLGIAEPKVVDLLSPSPPIRASKAMRFQENDHHMESVTIDLSSYELDNLEDHGRHEQEVNACEGEEHCQGPITQSVDVIDILDSDSDISPMHLQKARELRLFIESIKDDMY